MTKKYIIESDGGEVTMKDPASGVVLKWMEGESNTFICESIGNLSGAEYVKTSQEMTNYAYENGLLTEADRPMLIKQTARKMIGEQIKTARQEAGLTLRQLAELTGVAHNHISRIEQGRYNVNLDTLSDIADALGLKPTII